uniref:enolase-phosphatase E1-like n=1 Tax=Oncorhynchus gorbuscha TaxID=8017 RepID=UPI001EAEA6D9|nr:enolase-phosphatase E1-like [Oncorhynchus gorbuscha]
MFFCRSVWQRLGLLARMTVAPPLSRNVVPVRQMSVGIPGGSATNVAYAVLCGGGLTAAVVYAYKTVNGDSERYNDRLAEMNLRPKEAAPAAEEAAPAADEAADEAAPAAEEVESPEEPAPVEAEVLAEVVAETAAGGGACSSRGSPGRVEAPAVEVAVVTEEAPPEADAEAVIEDVADAAPGVVEEVVAVEAADAVSDITSASMKLLASSEIAAASVAERRLMHARPIPRRPD